jgi:hypothetical protein
MDKELEALIERLREASIVTSAIVLRHEERIKEHEEWLRQMELAAARHGEFVAYSEGFMMRLNEKLDRLADLILKAHTTNGN